MERILQISIKQMVFNVNEDAYEPLGNYLRLLNNHFAGTPDGAEIINDLENRLVELLCEKLNNKKQVITLADVNEVKNTLGDLYDLDPRYNAGYNSNRQKRRLYRDTKNNAIGGVASGIAVYFCIETVWVRLAFILTTFLNGAGLILYLIMWAVVPAARTVNQQAEMQGEKADIHNFENTIKNEYARVKNNFRKFQNNEAYEQSKRTINNVIYAIGRVLLLCIKIGIGIVGVGLVIALVFSVFGMGFTFFNPTWPGWSVNEWGFYFNHFEALSFFLPSDIILPVLISLWALILIPVLTVLYGIIKFIFNIKARDKITGILLLMAWGMALIFIISIMLWQLSNFTHRQESVHNYRLNTMHTDTIVIAVSDNLSDKNNWFNNQWCNAYTIAGINGTSTIYGIPEINIEVSDSNQLSLCVYKKAYGEDQDDANLNAESIIYHWQNSGNRIEFDRVFAIAPGNYFRAQDLNMVLYIPQGTIIYIDDTANELIDGMETNDYTWEYGGKYWKAESEKFKFLNEPLAK